MEKEKSSRWTVVAVWEGKILENGTKNIIDLIIWDIVYFTKYSPEEIEVEWKKYLLMGVSGILAKEIK
jgi:chaperonin GroES